MRVSDCMCVLHEEDHVVGHRQKMMCIAYVCAALVNMHLTAARAWCLLALDTCVSCALVCGFEPH